MVLGRPPQPVLLQLRRQDEHREVLRFFEQRRRFDRFTVNSLDRHIGGSVDFVDQLAAVLAVARIDYSQTGVQDPDTAAEHISEDQNSGGRGDKRHEDRLRLQMFQLVKQLAHQASPIYLPLPPRPLRGPGLPGPGPPRTERRRSAFPPAKARL
jgi:hypothetical protein